MKNKYHDNLEKVKYIYNQLNLLNVEFDKLVFNLKNATCYITYKKFAYELHFKDNNFNTPEDLLFHKTSKLEFYNLVSFVTDNIRVKSNILD